MTLARLVAKNALRNKRRTLPTILSLAFSILLLTVMLTLWHSFYIDDLGPASALRIFTRTRVFFSYAMPSDYRQKIKAVPGVVAVAPMNIFNGVYKDGKSNDRFPQGGTDPEEFLKVYRDYEIPRDQVKAWQNDRAGAIVENALILGPLFLFNNLHAAHHLRHRLPWYRLPKFYRLNRAALIERNGGLVYQGYFDVARRYLLRRHDSPVHPGWDRRAA